MNLKYKIMAVSALGLSIITGCSRDIPPPVMYGQPAAQQPAPVVIQQAPAQHDSGPGVGTALMAGAAGYMLGSAGSRNQAQPQYQAPAQHTTVVHKTTVINKAPVKPWYAPTRPKSSYTTTTRTTTTSKGRR